MGLTLPTKSQIQQKANTYVLANSTLTDIRQSGNLNALTGSNAAVLADFYRDVRISFLQAAIQGAFNVFNFNALPGTQSSTTLTVTVSEATTIPQGFTVSTVGNSNSPAVLFQAPNAVQATGAGNVSVPIQAVNVGSAGNVASGSITNMITAVPGVVSVSNASAAIGGTDPESLSQQLNRFQTYVQNLDGAKASALSYAASQVPGVVNAVAYSPQQLTGLQDANNVFTDYSQAINSPKGLPFSPFVTTPTLNDTFYIGANGPFDSFYIDVSTSGSALNATWQYYSSSGWTTLTTTSDTSNNGQNSGIVAFNVPTDWKTTTVNVTTAYFVRLILNSTIYTSMPSWYSVFTNNPPPGYVNVYVITNPNVANVLQNVQTACDAIRASGDTVVINTATQIAQNITMTVIPTQAGASQDLTTMITNALNQLFAGLNIGQNLAISDITYAVTSLGAGTYVAEVNVSTPSNNITVAPYQQLTAGTYSISIGAAQS